MCVCVCVCVLVCVCLALATFPFSKYSLYMHTNAKYSRMAHLFVILQCIGINAILPVDNTAILLHHPNQLGSTITQVVTGMESHITKPLRNEEFARACMYIVHTIGTCRDTCTMKVFPSMPGGMLILLQYSSSLMKLWML